LKNKGNRNQEIYALLFVAPADRYPIQLNLVAHRTLAPWLASQFFSECAIFGWDR